MKKVTKKEIDNIKTEDIFIDDEYAELYSVYHYLVTMYLSEKMNLKKTDNYFSESELNYLNVKEEDMDVFQYLSSPILNYLYIRNFIHIERLNEEEKEFLKNISQNEKLNQDTISFIESTMNRILSANNNDAFVIYGSNNIRYGAPGNALVLGFRYDEFNYNGMTDEEWDINHEKQVIDISKQLVLLECEMSEFKIMPCRIFQYDDFSIKKMNNNQIKQL